MSSPPASQPPTDWSKWEPAGEGDVRSPCPMLNALSNHHVLPHSGKGITAPMAIEALVSAINLDRQIADFLSTNAVKAAPDHATTHAFDLNHVAKHGYIEHDVSLSRGDASHGDNTSFDRKAWDVFLKAFGDATETSFTLASKAKYARLEACRKEHATNGTGLEYGVKEVILSYAESALYLGHLGGAKDGKVPLEYVKVLFEQERLPYTEGWRRSEAPITKGDVTHCVLSLMAANEHKVAEAAEAGVGTLHAVKHAVDSALGSYCTIM